MPYPKPKLTLITSFTNPLPPNLQPPNPNPNSNPKPPSSKNPASNAASSPSAAPSNQDICVHRIKSSSLPLTNTSIPIPTNPNQTFNTSNTSQPEDNGKAKYGAELISAQLKHFKPEYIHHTPLPHITASALAAKVSSLLLPRKERDRFALPMPSPGYGRRTLRPLGERLEAERLEVEEEERRVRERVEREMKREIEKERAMERARERVERGREEWEKAREEEMSFRVDEFQDDFSD
ncbi:hypothetical protein DL95DRAFT_408201 [Leptodontidium sp. 2 PMI_412]|nr:hypothetical protein DL95DRAFT_408201 [Leptodontidium sp. 2 PMI_412]